MPINKDLSDLPRRGNRGMAPSPHPFIVEHLAAAWEKWYDAEHGSREFAIPEAGPYRGSMASMRCDRQLYYAMSETPESNPTSLAGKFTLWLGQLIHAALQPIIVEAFPGSLTEQNHDYRKIGIPGSAHSDVEIVYELAPGDEVLAEIKTTGGFSYKMMATNFKGPAQGPRYGMVLQAAMAAKERGYSKLVILLVGLEPVSPSMAQSYADSDAGRFMVEWHFTVDELEDHITLEAERINAVAQLIEQNQTNGEATLMLPTRRLRDPEYPDGAIIQRPLVSDTPWTVTDEEGRVLDSGTTWMCGYCRWFDRCKADG